MTMIAQRPILTVAILLSMTTLAMANDGITRKSDEKKKLSGTITSMTKTELILKTSKGDETVPANDIALIEWDGGGPELKLGYTDENNGKFDSAAQRFNKAKETVKSPSDFLKGEIEYGLARIAGKQALEGSEKRDQAVKGLMSVIKAYPEHVRYFETVMLLIQVQLAGKDYAGARTTIELLKKAPWSDYALASRIASGRVLMDEGKTTEAIAEFDAAAVAATDSPSDQLRKYEAMVGQARGLISQTKYDEAVKVLDVVSQKVAKDGESVQAEAYMLQGQALLSLGRLKEAILAYLHVDLIYPREADYHAESLYQLSQLCKQDQHAERGDEAAAKLIQLYPNSEWRKKLAGKE